MTLRLKNELEISTLLLLLFFFHFASSFYLSASLSTRLNEPISNLVRQHVPIIYFLI